MTRRITLVGHPFAPIGMGEHLRATFHALRTVGADAWVRDVYDVGGREGDDAGELRERLLPRLSSDVSIFTLNGDEREPCFRRLGPDLGGAGYRIVYPAWELPIYPEPWARELEHYDEVWSTSSYTAASLRAAVRRDVRVMPLPCHPRFTRRFSRRHFGISETAYVFVFFFDLTSYVQRKNPYALLEAVGRVRAARPFAEFQVVMKLGSPNSKPAEAARFREALKAHGRDVKLIDTSIQTPEGVAPLVTARATVEVAR